MGEHHDSFLGMRSWARRAAARGALPALRLALLLAVSTAVAKTAQADPAPAKASGDLPALPFDHFMPYDELTRLLHGWAAARPGLVKLESLGRTVEGLLRIRLPTLAHYG